MSLRGRLKSLEKAGGTVATAAGSAADHGFLAQHEAAERDWIEAYIRGEDRPLPRPWQATGTGTGWDRDDWRPHVRWGLTTAACIFARLRGVIAADEYLPGMLANAKESADLMCRDMRVAAECEGSAYPLEFPDPLGWMPPPMKAALDRARSEADGPRGEW